MTNEIVCFAVWALAMIAVPLAFVVAVPRALRNASSSRGRWGDRLVVHEAERGPYREGLATERIPRAAPLSVWLMATAAPAWAVITLLVVAPVCAFVALFEGFCRKADWDHTCEVPAALDASLAIGGLVLAGSGLVLGVRLIRDAVGLPTADAAELRASRITAIFGAVHHAALLAWWVTGTAVHGDLDSFPWVSTATLVLGALLALIQWRASAHVARSLASSEHAEGA